MLFNLKTLENRKLVKRRVLLSERMGRMVQSCSTGLFASSDPEDDEFDDEDEEDVEDE